MSVVGEVAGGEGQGPYENSLCFLLNLAVNLKLLSKMKSIFKKKKPRERIKDDSKIHLIQNKKEK